MKVGGIQIELPAARQSVQHLQKALHGGAMQPEARDGGPTKQQRVAKAPVAVAGHRRRRVAESASGRDSSGTMAAAADG